MAQPTVKEAHFMLNVLANQEGKPKINWENVAKAAGLKNAACASVRFGQIKKRLGWNDGSMTAVVNAELDDDNSVAVASGSNNGPLVPCKPAKAPRATKAPKEPKAGRASKVSTPKNAQTIGDFANKITKPRGRTSAAAKKLANAAASAAAAATIIADNAAGIAVPTPNQGPEHAHHTMKVKEDMMHDDEEHHPSVIKTGANATGDINEEIAALEAAVRGGIDNLTAPTPEGAKGTETKDHDDDGDVGAQIDRIKSEITAQNLEYARNANFSSMGLAMGLDLDGEDQMMGESMFSGLNGLLGIDNADGFSSEFAGDYSIASLNHLGTSLPIIENTAKEGVADTEPEVGALDSGYFDSQDIEGLAGCGDIYQDDEELDDLDGDIHFPGTAN